MASSSVLPVSLASSLIISSWSLAFVISPLQPRFSFHFRHYYHLLIQNIFLITLLLFHFLFLHLSSFSAFFIFISFSFFINGFLSIISFSHSHLELISSTEYFIILHFHFLLFFIFIISVSFITDYISHFFFSLLLSVNIGFFILLSSFSLWSLLHFATSHSFSSHSLIHSHFLHYHFITGLH